MSSEKFSFHQDAQISHQISGSTSSRDRPSTCPRSLELTIPLKLKPNNPMTSVTCSNSLSRSQNSLEPSNLMVSRLLPSEKPSKRLRMPYQPGILNMSHIRTSYPDCLHPFSPPTMIESSSSIKPSVFEHQIKNTYTSIILLHSKTFGPSSSTYGMGLNTAGGSSGWSGGGNRCNADGGRRDPCHNWNQGTCP